MRASAAGGGSHGHFGLPCAVLLRHGAFGGGVALWPQALRSPRSLPRLSGWGPRCPLRGAARRVGVGDSRRGTRTLALVEDQLPLLTAVDRLADRLRALPASALRNGAAAEGLALARRLAADAQRVAGDGVAGRPRSMPDAGVFVVADQVAVAGHDLHAALRALTAGRRGDTAEQAARIESAAVASIAEVADRCRVSLAGR